MVAALDRLAPLVTWEVRPASYLHGSRFGAFAAFDCPQGFTLEFTMAAQHHECPFLAHWRARREKPRVSAFTSADIPKILDLEPDLVLTFSDLQADIAAALIRQGVDVHAFNWRTIAEILDMIRTLGSLVDAQDRAKRLTDDLVVATTNARRRASRLPFRPKVYFEEWDDPMISGIALVSELIEIAGGIDVFADLAHCKSAKDRIVTGEQIIARAPDIIVGSWCGKKFRPEKVVNRAGFDALPAVRRGAVHEIKSPLILQPGPAALTDGLAAMEAIIANSVAAYDRRTV